MCLCRDEASDSGMGVRQPQAGSNTRGTMARPPDMEPSSPEGVRNPPSRTTPQATTYSHQGGSDWAADPSTRAGSSKASTGDIELSMSGVMPRRDDLPAPSTNPGLSRVFKVIFLGKLCYLHWGRHWVGKWVGPVLTKGLAAILLSCWPGDIIHTSHVVHQVLTSLVMGR